MNNMSQEQEMILLGVISKMLMPLASPYDQSEAQRFNQYRNNPYFNMTCKAVLNLIRSDGLTAEKILMDLQLMKQFKL